MAIQITQDARGVAISGSYPEMEGILGRLKRLGFKWDSSHRVWYLLPADVTPKKLDSVKALIGVDEDTRKLDPEAAKGFLKTWVRAHPSADLMNQFDGGVTFQMTFPLALAKKLKAIGANPQGKLWVLAPENLDVDGLPEVLDDIAKWMDQERQEQEAAQRVALRMREQIQTWAKQHSEEIPEQIKLSLGIPARLFGLPFDMNGTLKHLFPRAQWDSGSWALPYSSLEDFKNLFAMLETIPPPPQVAPRKFQGIPNRPNQRPGKCYYCHKVVAAGGGVVFQIFDGDGIDGEPPTDDMVWAVSHRECVEKYWGRR